MRRVLHASSMVRYFLPCMISDTNIAPFLCKIGNIDLYLQIVYTITLGFCKRYDGVTPPSFRLARPLAMRSQATFSAQKLAQQFYALHNCRLFGFVGGLSMTWTICPN